MAGARTCPIYRGVFALGFTLDDTKRLIREALEQHLAAMRADGDEIPEPSYVELVEVTSHRQLHADKLAGCHFSIGSLSLRVSRALLQRAEP